MPIAVVPLILDKKNALGVVKTPPTFELEYESNDVHPTSRGKVDLFKSSITSMSKSEFNVLQAPDYCEAVVDRARLGGKFGGFNCSDFERDFVFTTASDGEEALICGHVLP